MNSLNILIVDDDVYFCKTLKFALSKASISATSISDYDEIANFINNIHNINSFDAIILDYRLTPKINGLFFCHKIRKYSNIPIVMLTGMEDLDTLESCLNAGADQYIVKPCASREIIARIKAASKNQRYKNNDNNKSLTFASGKLILDSKLRTLRYKSKIIKLTEKETLATTVMISKVGIDISRDEISILMYGDSQQNIMSRKIDITVARIRKKINELSAPLKIMHIRGVGYKMEIIN